MLTLNAKKLSGQNVHGNGSASSNSRVLCAVVVSFVLQLVAGQNATHTDGSPTGKTTRIQTGELELAIVHDKNLTLNMEEASEVHVNLTLHCSHPSIAYTIRLSCEDTNVASLDESEVFSVNCSDVVFPHVFSRNAVSPSLASENLSSSHPAPEGTEKSNLLTLESVPVVQGGFNFTLTGEILGRTWLHIFGERYADPGVTIPTFLRLPWNTTKERTTGSSESLSTNETPHPPPSATSRKNDTAVDPVPVNTVADPPENLVSHTGTDAPYDVASHDDRSVRSEAELQKHMVTVLRVIRPVDIAFRGVLYGFVIMATVGMGCKTELSVVKEVLKKPVAPAIGFGCQYLCMPLIAFTLAKTLVVGDPALSLGIFTCGICPGGGPSNMYCYLLDGDVSLSVTMTAISSVAALAMIPLWLFTLGTLFEDDKISLEVPFGRIIMTLAIIIIPLFIGLAVKRWAPKVAKWILRLLKPFTLLVILFLLTFGIYANLYVFSLFSPRTILAGCLLPYIGYLLGGLISLLLRQPCYRVKTIAIETGIQNTSIAYLLLVFSLPRPDGDMAAVGPMASALMTPLPLFVLVLVYLLYKRCSARKRNKDKRDGGKEGGREEEEEEEEETALREGEGGIEEKNGNVQK